MLMCTYVHGFLTFYHAYAKGYMCTLKYLGLCKSDWMSYVYL